LTRILTGYFGLVTFGAVKKFQSQYGFSPTGFVGTLTRGKVKDITCNGNGGTISIPPIPVTPTNPSDRSNSNNNLPKGCTSNTLFNPLTGERCIESRSTSTQQPYISMVAGKAAGNFEVDAGSPAYISGSNLSNVSVSVGGKLATVTQTGDSYIYATMPSDLVPGQTYDLFVYRGLSGIYSNVVKVKVLSKMTSTSSTQPSCSITTNKSSYNLGETITFSWTSQNATYASFQQDISGKDSLWLPGDKLFANGSQSVTARVIGNPVVTLLVGGNGGTGLCKVMVNIISPTSSTQPSITVLSPNGGENLQVGSTYKITWKDSREKGLPQLYNVSFFGSNSKEFIRENVNWSSCVNGICSIDWTVPSSISSNNYISIDVANDYSGSSVGRSGYFNIVSSTSSTQPSITVFNPNGGESFKKGDYIQMSWSSVGMDNVSVSLISSSGASYLVSSFAPANAGGAMKDYSWLIPDSLPLGSYKVKVSGYFTGKGSVDDISDSYFTIVSPTSSTQPLEVSCYGYVPTNTSNIVWTSSAGGISPISYSWTLTDDVATYFGGSSVSSSISASYSSAGTKSASIRVSDGLGRSTKASCQAVITTEPASYPAKISTVSPNRARVGDPVIIYGSDFNTSINNSVNITGNGAGAMVPSATKSATQTSFIVPGMPAGTYSLYVNNNKGKGNSNSVSFSIDLATSTSSFNSNQDMTANMFDALRSVNPSLYR
jgi:hypothetical protein